MYEREYELCFFTRPDIADEEIEAIRDRTLGIIQEKAGHVLEVDDWGKRKLAYDVQKFSKGHYYLITYLGGAEAVSEIERTFRIDDKVLRFLHIKRSDRVSVEERVAEFEAKAQEAAAAAAAAAVEAEPDGAAAAS